MNRSGKAFAVGWAEFRNISNARPNGMIEMPIPELITVASFETAPEAWIFRNRLASSGIEAFVVDEHTVNVYWLYSDAVGGVKVQIPNSQLGRHQEFLKQEIPPISELVIQAADFASDKPGLEVCQNCGSGEISVSMWSKPWTFVFWLVFGFPIPVYAPTTECADCGYKSRHSFEMPAAFQLPTQFQISHLLILTTIVAIVLGLSLQAGVNWLDTSTVQVPP